MHSGRVPTKSSRGRFAVFAVALLAFTLLVGMAPAPSDLVDAVDHIEVECSLEEASAFRVRFAISQTRIGDWNILETDPFVPFMPVSGTMSTSAPPGARSSDDAF